MLFLELIYVPHFPDKMIVKLEKIKYRKKVIGGNLTVRRNFIPSSPIIITTHFVQYLLMNLTD